MILFQVQGILRQGIKVTHPGPPLAMPLMEHTNARTCGGTFTGKLLKDFIREHFMYKHAHIATNCPGKKIILRLQDWCTLACVAGACA